MWAENELMLFAFVKDLEVGVGISDFGLVDSASGLDDPLLLVLIAGFMVDREFPDDLTPPGTHDGAAVPHIGDVALFAVKESDNSA